MKETMILYIKNGFYIPLLYIYALYLNYNLLHTTLIVVKMFPLNYYYWFSYLYDFENIPKQLNFVKQFVRFTDTGHIVSLCYLFDSSYLTLAHNVHFMIMVGYLGGRLCSIRDMDSLCLSGQSKEVIYWYEELWSFTVHIAPYLLFLRQLIISDSCYEFNFMNLVDTYKWLYLWFCVVYMPWRIYTHDPVYSILDVKENRVKQAKFILVLHISGMIGNIIGYGISRYICTLILLV